MAFGRLGEIAEEHIDRNFDTNVRGQVFAVQGALPLVRDGGSDGSCAAIRQRQAF